MSKLAHNKQSAFSGNRRLPTDDAAPTQSKPTRKIAGWKRIEWNQRNLVVMSGILLLCAAAYWIFHQNRTCTGVEFVGTKASDLTQLRALTPVKEGTVYADINTDAVADSIRRYPWVKDVQIDERWNGIFTVEVTERQPVLVVLDRQGYPQYYLDRTGRQMPISKNTSFDVPIVKGNTPKFKAGTWIGDNSLRELGWALAQIEPQNQALASSFYIRNSGSILMQTVAYGKAIPITVRLGLTDYRARLENFWAFWHQAVLTRPDKRFRWVDLRFDGQIVSKEEVL